MEWRPTAMEVSGQTWYGEARSMGLGQPPGKGLDDCSYLDYGSTASQELSTDYFQTVRQLLDSRRRLRQRRYNTEDELSYEDDYQIQQMQQYQMPQHYYPNPEPSSVYSSPQHHPSVMTMAPPPMAALAYPYDESVHSGARFAQAYPMSPASMSQRSTSIHSHGSVVGSEHTYFSRRPPPASPRSPNPTEASRKLLEKLAIQGAEEVEAEAFVDAEEEACDLSSESKHVSDQAKLALKSQLDRDDASSRNVSKNQAQKMLSASDNPTAGLDNLLRHQDTQKPRYNRSLLGGIDDEDIPVAKAIEIRLVRPNRQKILSLSPSPRHKDITLEQQPNHVEMRETQATNRQPHLSVGVQTSDEGTSMSSQADEKAISRPRTESIAIQTLVSALACDLVESSIQTDIVQSHDATTETNSDLTGVSQSSLEFSKVDAAVQTETETKPKVLRTDANVGTEPAPQMVDSAVDPIEELLDFLREELAESGDTFNREDESLRQTLARIQERLGQEHRSIARPPPVEVPSRRPYFRSHSTPESVGYVRSMAMQYDNRVAMLQEEITRGTNSASPFTPFFAEEQEPGSQHQDMVCEESSTCEQSSNSGDLSDDGDVVASRKFIETLSEVRKKALLLTKNQSISSRSDATTEPDEELDMDWRRKLDDVRCASSAVSDQLSSLRRMNQQL